MRHIGEVGVSKWQLFWVYASSGGVPRRAIIATIIVGALLNLINQGDALLAGHELDWVKLLLTYAVPYCVTTYGAVSFRLDAMRRSGEPG